MYRFNHPSAPNTRAEQRPEQSNRSTTLGGKSWKQALALSAVPLAMLFGAAFQSSNSVPAQLQAIQSQLNALQAQVTSLANKGPRKFYVTKTTHSGAQALSACAEGYHMASLREIFDTSNLRYDTELGGTTDDSEEGTWRAGQQARRSDQGGPQSQPRENQKRSGSDRGGDRRGSRRTGRS
jgi:hypothetical protein